MAHILSLIIPFHGVFLSFFLFIYSERGTGPNFFLGLMLLVLSAISFFQHFQIPQGIIISIHPFQYFTTELLIGPFLFMYNLMIIHPASKQLMSFHLRFITIGLLLLIGSVFGNSLINSIMIALLSFINGLYLSASLFLLADIYKKRTIARGQILFSEYSLIFVLNILVLAAFILSMLLYGLCPVEKAYFAQLPKGLAIYYIYYKILDKIQAESQLR